MGENYLKSQLTLGDFCLHLGFHYGQQVMDKFDRGGKGAKEEQTGPRPLPAKRVTSLFQTSQEEISNPQSQKSKTVHGSVWCLVLTQPLRHQPHHILPSVFYPFYYLLNIFL